MWCLLIQSFKMIKKIPSSHLKCLNLQASFKLHDSPTYTKKSLTFFSTVNKLSCVHAFRSNKDLFPKFVPVWIPKADNGQRSTTSWVMDDLLNNSLQITITFRVVQRSELGRSFSVFSMGLEDTPSSLTLASNNSTHIYCNEINTLLNTDCTQTDGALNSWTNLNHTVIVLRNHVKILCSCNEAMLLYNTPIIWEHK